MSRGLDWERANQREAARPAPREDPIVAWWLTPARRGSRCGQCHEPIPPGAAAIYRHHDQYTICEICASDWGIVPKPSRAWNRMERRGGPHPPQPRRRKPKPKKRARRRKVKLQPPQPPVRSTAVDEIARRIDAIGFKPRKTPRS